MKSEVAKHIMDAIKIRGDEKKFIYDIRHNEVIIQDLSIKMHMLSNGEIKTILYHPDSKLSAEKTQEFSFQLEDLDADFFIDVRDLFNRAEIRRHTMGQMTIYSLFRELILYLDKLPVIYRQDAKLYKLNFIDCYSRSSVSSKDIKFHTEEVKIEDLETVKSNLRIREDMIGAIRSGCADGFSLDSPHLHSKVFLSVNEGDKIIQVTDLEYIPRLAKTQGEYGIECLMLHGREWGRW